MSEQEAVMIQQTYPYPKPRAIALRFEVVADDNLPQIADGIEAFHRGEYPQPDWHPAKLDGWNVAGMTAYHRCMMMEVGV